jgi:hypothetical protein
MFTFIKDKHNKCQHYAIDCEYHEPDTVTVLDERDYKITCVYGFLILVSIPVVYKIILYFV